MYLITLIFDVAEEDQEFFVGEMEKLKDFWETQGFVFSLFRDTSRKSRLLLLFLTEKTVDDLTYLIQNHSEAKSMFEQVKEKAGHVVISCMEQLA
jgi:hypothetical protein